MNECPFTLKRGEISQEVQGHSGISSIHAQTLSPRGWSRAAGPAGITACRACRRSCRAAIVAGRSPGPAAHGAARAPAGRARWRRSRRRPAGWPGTVARTAAAARVGRRRVMAPTVPGRRRAVHRAPASVPRRDVRAAGVAPDSPARRRGGGPSVTAGEAGAPFGQHGDVANCAGFGHRGPPPDDGGVELPAVDEDAGQGIEEQQRDHHRGQAAIGRHVVAGVFGQVGGRRPC